MGSKYIPQCPIPICPEQWKHPLMWECPKGIVGGCCYPQPLLPNKTEEHIKTFKQLREVWKVEETKAYWKKIELKREAEEQQKKIKWTAQEIQNADYIRANLGKRSIEETERILKECCERIRKENNFHPS